MDFYKFVDFLMMLILLSAYSWAAFAPCAKAFIKHLGAVFR